MIRKKGHSTIGSADVRLIHETIIECVLKGAITGSIVEQSMKETKELVDAVKKEGGQPVLLIDMRELTSQDSAARSQSKALVTFGLKKIAIVGADRTLKTIGQYIVRIAGMYNYTKFFSRYTGAVKWLQTAKADSYYRRPRLAVLTGIIVGLIGVAALVGWAIGNEALVALSPNFKAMNPVTALNFILISIIILLLASKYRKATVSKAAISLVAIWLLLYGTLTTLRHIFHLPVTIDTWLFTDRLELFSTLTGRASLGSGVVFLSIGLLILLILRGLKNKWGLILFRSIATIVILGIVITLAGYSFGIANLYESTVVPMPLNSTFAFLLCITGIITIVYKPGLFPLASRLFSTYGRGLIMFAVIMFLTGLSWQQAHANVERNIASQAQQLFIKSDGAIQNRINSYTDALHGFKAFFESSDSVSAADFHHYFTHSELQQNYPGFNAISFIRVVKPNEKIAYEREMRSQFNTFPDLKNFAAPPSTGKTQYLASYIEPSTSATAHGTDVSLLPSRLATFEAARDSGEEKASDRITFTASDGTQEDGFIITIPIYAGHTTPSTTAERQENIYGFVNAVFRNKVIFGEIFKEAGNDENAAFRIIDGNTLMYQSSSFNDTGTANNELSRTINVAGREWEIALHTSKDFAVTRSTYATPRLIFTSGMLLAVLSGALVVTVSRRREEALALASSMTEDLNNEREVAETIRKKDEAILASIGDAVFAIDTKERITLFNPAAEAISGFKQSEVIGKDYKDILAFIGEDGRPNYSFIRRALDGHLASMKGDTKLIRKDSTFVEVADSAAPIRDLEGNLQGVIVVFRDVSSERELDRAKSEFVSLASHQLRTPLSAINWYSEMMLDQDAGKLSKDQREYMKEIYEGNQRMIELVDSLLNVSRLEVGKLRNDPQDVSMTELLDSLEKEMQTSIVTKKLSFTKTIESRLPVVSADPKLLRMIVQNLFSNAVKYTPSEGNVTITMRKAHANEIEKSGAKSKNCLFISVSDTGYGIPLEQQGKIFEKLFRADNVRKMDVEGTGLGLYIVKEVAKKLGGDIWFESAESLGTTFYVVIPFTTKPS